jgi:hypothetical protein
MTERNMDLIRDLLLKIEKLEFPNSSIRYYLQDLAGNSETEEHSRSVILYHLNLLQNAGNFMFTTDGKAINGISMSGHDFLDSVRDPAIWKRTREGALATGGWSVDLLKDLAKGFIKKKAEEVTGIPL